MVVQLLMIFVVTFLGRMTLKLSLMIVVKLDLQLLLLELQTIVETTLKHQLLSQ